MEEPLFAGAFGIFGHGNVVSLAEALYPVQDVLPTWRGHNEQSMALAAVAFAKAKRRRQIMIATSSVGPGSSNMITAAATAHANRLPVLFFSGDTFQHRFVDPVLQQLEHFDSPSTTVSDAYRAVTRYWDRITRPEQVIQSLPHAVATMLDPADCGPAYIGLPQDIAAEAYDYPVEFFKTQVHYIRRPIADPRDIERAAAALAAAEKPLIIAGGGVHYSGAVAELTAFAEKHGIPVTETVAGKATLLADHPNFVGPLGVTGSTSANVMADDADVVAGGGNTAPGLHHRFVVDLRQRSHDAGLGQRRAFRRNQTPGRLGDRRCQDVARRNRRRHRRLPGTGLVAGARRRGAQLLVRLSR